MQDLRRKIRKRLKKKYSFRKNIFFIIVGAFLFFGSCRQGAAQGLNNQELIYVQNIPQRNIQCHEVKEIAFKSAILKARGISYDEMYSLYYLEGISSAGAVIDLIYAVHFPKNVDEESIALIVSNEIQKMCYSNQFMFRIHI